MARCAAPSWVYTLWSLIETAHCSLHSLSRHPLAFKGIPFNVQLLGEAYACVEFDMWIEPGKWNGCPTPASSYSLGGAMNNEENFLLDGLPKLHHFEAYSFSVGMFTTEKISCPTSYPGH